MYGEEKCKDCAQEYVRNRQLARPPTTDPLARSLPHSDRSLSISRGEDRRRQGETLRYVVTLLLSPLVSHDIYVYTYHALRVMAPSSAGKWGKLIAQEARSDPDPASNPRLKDIVAQAKAAQVPADIIDRNLKKGSESKADYQEMLYEAYGVAGTGFIIEALTDNVNRTAAEVRTAVTKAGGKMADSGSVLFNFSRTGLVMVDAEEDEDVVFDAAIDAGAQDVQKEEEGSENEGYRVLTSLEDYAAVQKKLIEAGLKVNAEMSGLVYVPLVVKGEDEVTDEDFEANEAILERILDVDDVDAVFKNY